jgi:hypothetical protein
VDLCFTSKEPENNHLFFRPSHSREPAVKGVHSRPDESTVKKKREPVSGAKAQVSDASL